MTLQQAFGIQAKEIVSFVGGGGKTTAMFRLAQELVAQGKRVVTTTTTRIFAAQIALAPHHIFAGENRDNDKDHAALLRKVQAALGAHAHVLVVGGEGGEGKAFGIEPVLVEQLSALEEVDAVLIEADGSRMRPFKAPAEHEPVVPAVTTLLVPVVGIDVIGKRLDEEHVHRAALVAKVADVPLGTILNTEHVARVLADARGGLRHRPAGARVIPLINKVETQAQQERALAIADELLKHEAIQAVAIGRVKNLQSPISNLNSRVCAVILAAGGSTRLRGGVKQLLPWGDATFVRNAVDVAKASRAAQVVIVTGNQRVEVEKELEGMQGIRIVYNSDWQTGRASSVRAGLAAVDERMAGAIFVNADQPFLTAHIINTIVQRFFETRARIVAPVFAGQTGSPVLFARALFDELRALQGEQGGRELLQAYGDEVLKVEFEDARAAVDVDTPEEYAEALKLNAEP